MRHYKDKSAAAIVLAFIAAVLFATVWGSIVQTQFNLWGLASIGADIRGGLRLQATMADIFSGFTPTYAGYVVAPALLVAFVAARWVASRFPGSAAVWFAAAGGLAILLAIPLVNWLSPVALLIGATRDWSCTLLMALGGIGAGLLFAYFPGGSRKSGGARKGVDRGAQDIVVAP